MTNAVLFTGLIRDEERFRESLDTVLQARDSGEVSTIATDLWADNAQDFPSCVKTLEHHGVRISIHEPPPFDHLFEKDGGFGMKQLGSLRLGLPLVYDAKTVLRTRFDLTLPEGRTGQIFNSCSPGDMSAPGLLPGRISIPAASFIRPFTCHDWYFAADLPTMTSMAALDLEYFRHFFRRYEDLPVRTFCGFAMWFFLNPFMCYCPLRQYAVLSPFFDKAAHHYVPHVRMSLKTGSFLALLSFYFDSLIDDFAIITPTDVAFFSKGNSLQNKYINGVQWRDRVLGGRYRLALAGLNRKLQLKIPNIYFADMGFLEQYRSTPKFGDRLLKRIRAFSDDPEQRLQTANSFMRDQLKIIGRLYGQEVSNQIKEAIAELPSQEAKTFDAL